MPTNTYPVFFEPSDLYLFGEGKLRDLYKLLGVHPDRRDGVDGFKMSVWAPNATEVHAVGSFNDWRWGEYPLFPVGSSGIWSAFVPYIKKGDLYKFGIRSRDGQITYKADPISFFAEVRPGIASLAWGLPNFNWSDQNWLEKRKNTNTQTEPMSIYEVHAGSWKRNNNIHSPFLSYSEIAKDLVPYVKNAGFTHIEFLPLAEHPLDQSWGYQTGHYFAPTSRFGDPEGLCKLIDQCHNEGIGVILDWVPAHFPKDSWSLGRFDGTALYEHADPRKGEHPDWGTYIFNYSRHEVRNFLLSNAYYWLKEFHFDGLRIDAVASMLYLDYSRNQGEWIANEYGGKENNDAISFLKELNTMTHSELPGSMVIAEESTAWTGVSQPVYNNGLGFTFKWNMGWMHDTLNYMQIDPIYRKYHQNVLTFSMLYAFSEHYMLPFSHDEVVHGKKALLAKMPGDMWQQQANLRLMYSYMWAHPGKKLLFMGGEIGQWNEWDESKSMDWELLDFPAHQGILNTVKTLNGILKDYPAMYEQDNTWQGFSWVDFSNSEASILSFMRHAKTVSKPVFWIFNFTPVPRYDYHITAAQLCGFSKTWKQIYNSDEVSLGGSGITNSKLLSVYGEGDNSYLEVTLPPLAAIALIPE